jgi:hypothetical protein
MQCKGCCAWYALLIAATIINTNSESIGLQVYDTGEYRVFCSGAADSAIDVGICNLQGE